VDVLYSAAHADFPDSEPLGGGKAVADYLIRRWRQDRPFPLRILSPRTLGLSTPKPLTELSELEYARFCRQFEKRTTEGILGHDPRSSIVLSNDVSEGPDFAALGARGYRLVTIFHVDVVDYFTRMYLKGVLPPHVLTKLHRFGLLPDVLRLVFQKQYDCVRHSLRLVVPSAPMRATIRRCYPSCPEEKIEVLPWGNIAPAVDTQELPALDVDPDEFVLLTLSRLSPEKGIERLLRSLRHVQTNRGRVSVFICGAPAFMRGHAYARKLRRAARGIDRFRIVFTGHVTDPMKAALLRRADVFVSPSLHESYGLAIAEAEAAGCRILSHPHYGARGTVVNCADCRLLADAISTLIAAGRTERRPIGFADAARELAGLLQSLAGSPAPGDQTG
jgi:glycosyltransferase involved in cell wall biosynthesis